MLEELGKLFHQAASPKIRNFGSCFVLPLGRKYSAAVYAADKK
jgi:hypothetical protein